MLAFQSKSRLAMIEFLLRWFPANQPKIFTVVFQVAADAVFAFRILHLDVEVIPVLRGKVLRDFLVAIEATERGRTGSEYVTRTALGGPRQRSVCLRKGTRRNLRVHRDGPEKQHQEQSKRYPLRHRPSGDTAIFFTDCALVHRSSVSGRCFPQILTAQHTH